MLGFLLQRGELAALPYLIFASLTLIAGVLVIPLPETANRQLPQSLKGTDRTVMSVINNIQFFYSLHLLHSRLCSAVHWLLKVII